MKSNKCKECGYEFGRPLKANNKKFCSVYCRNRFNAKINKEFKAARQRMYYRKRTGLDNKDLVECKICGLGFRQVGSHIVQVHGMTALEYKKKFGFDRIKGIVPKDYKQLKSELVDDNIKKMLTKVGKKTRFKKGQEGLGKYTRSQQTLERLKQKSFIKKDKKNNL